MKSICCVIALVLSIARMDASSLNLDGDLSWEITEPQCSFTLDGTLQNLSPYTTGSIKLVLFAGRSLFPAREFIAGEKSLGQLNSGAQFTNFSLKVKSTIPSVSGDYYFTLAILEFNGSYWQAIRILASGKKSLENGNFTTQKRWTIPSAAVIAPPSTLIAGNSLRLSPKATQELNLLPLTSRKNSKISIQSRTKLTVSNRTGTQTLPFTYTMTKDSLNKKSVAVARIIINDAPKNPSPANTQLTLYFHTPNSGTYKSSETLNSFTENNWGSFSFN